MPLISMSILIGIGIGTGIDPPVHISCVISGTIIIFSGSEFYPCYLNGLDTKETGSDIECAATEGTVLHHPVCTPLSSLRINFGYPIIERFRQAFQLSLRTILRCYYVCKLCPSHRVQRVGFCDEALFFGEAVPEVFGEGEYAGVGGAVVVTEVAGYSLPDAPVYLVGR